MSQNKEVIAIAFEQVRKQGSPKIGDVVGVRDKRFPLAYNLVGIEDDTAICALPDGSQTRFPLKDVADVDEVKRVANAIYINGQIEAMRICKSLLSQNNHQAN